MGAVRTARGAAAAVCAVVLLSGCSAGGGSSAAEGGAAGGAEGGAEGGASASTGSSSSSTSEGTFPAPVKSPLEEYFYAGDPTSEEELAAQQAQYESVVAACMQQEGFEYEPFPESAIIPFLADSAAPSVQDAATDGYSITTFDPSALEEGSQDPNEAFVQGMSESERTAYDQALHGAPSAPSDPDAPTDWSQAGCQGEAHLEVVGPDPLGTSAGGALREEVGRVYTALGTSPEVLTLVAAWSDCMADAGYPGYEALDDPAEDIRAREAALAEDADEDDPAAYSQQPAYVELEELEVATAVADAECQQEVDYTEQERRVRFAAEQDFVDANRAELEAMAAAAGTGS